MTRTSAGILLYRYRDGALAVLLVHPGGPFWTTKDLGAWSIPKGLIGPGEDPLAAALREFREETGFRAHGSFIKLSPVKMKSGKVVEAWAVEGDAEASKFESNTFSMEWPPGSGRQGEFPEVDQAAWFEVEEAKRKINQGQMKLLDELQHLLSGASSAKSKKITCDTGV
jgi:predicted NUDIX family NTP pyrophosphohydrolase